MSFQTVGARFSTCGACEQPLPLWSASLNELPIVWQCSGCGDETTGVLVPNCPPDQLRYLRREVIGIHHSPPPAPAELVEFAQQVNLRDEGNIEKRSSGRHATLSAVPALELNKQLNPVDEPFTTICRNISQGGICLLNERAIVAPFLAVEFSATDQAPIQMLIRILRRRPLGPYHDIGGEFLHKMFRPQQAN